MEETMNTEVETTTEETNLVENDSTDFGYSSEELSSGPSKGFIALVAGGIVAAGIGVTVAWKRHKKKKAARLEGDVVDEKYPDQNDEEYYEDDENEEVVIIRENESEKTSEKSK